MNDRTAAEIDAEVQRLLAMTKSPDVQRVVAEAPPLTRQQFTALRAIFTAIAGPSLKATA